MKAMEVLCASCRRRLVSQVIQLRLWNGCGLIRTRAIHLSAPYREFNKPKVDEEDASLPPKVIEFPVPILQTPPTLGSQGELNQSQDDKAIKEHYHDNPDGEETVEEWREQKIELVKLPGIYLRLSKHKLTMLVVITTLAGYSMAPGSVGVATLLWTTVGTSLCSGAANSFNQWIEVPFDSQMARTRNRVLVRGIISPLHASLFGLTAGLTGASILYHLVNPLTAALGVSNMLLYTLAYTPLKRISIINTWIGSVVGSIPPLMGWAACTGTLEPGAFVLAAILYAWQFAHFNALSWGLRGDYSRAGYRMMAVTDPELCKRVALRYSLATIPICSVAAPLFDVTSLWFSLDSLVPNVWLSYLAWRFYNDSDYKSARRLFQFSLFHLPLLMGLLLLNKKSRKDEEKTQVDLV